MSESWERVAELFHAAVDLREEERVRLYDTECAGNGELRALVERLVRSHQHAGAFIETPPVAAARSWVEDAGNDVIGLGDRRVGAYRLIREIGHGGMGAVYLAERDDGDARHYVAVKLIKRGMYTDVVLRRFRAERQILAALDHPNIARLLDAGTAADGRPYLAMEYVDGKPIDEYADAERLSIRDRLGLFLPVCAAVGYAHRQHVVHRDLKPANVLVTADGLPKLLDFGIARMLEPGEQDLSASVTGIRLLTTDYASPEQIEGERATPASDVYSLGVVLYELLTGRSPYRVSRADPGGVMVAIRTTQPEPPSAALSRVPDDRERGTRRARLAEDRSTVTGGESMWLLLRRLRGDLDAIILTALHKDPARRYHSVDELAADIRCHLDGLPLSVRAGAIAVPSLTRPRAE